MKRVVVGTDGTDDTRSTLSTALLEARLRGARLDVVVAYGSPHGDPERLAAVSAERAARNHLEATRAGAGIHDVEATVRAVAGPAVPALLQSAADAELLVVGTHGPGSWLTGRVGSVTAGCLAGAAAPVLVVPGSGPGPHVPRDGGILAAVDLSSLAEHVILAAAQEARIRHERLKILHVIGAELPAAIMMDPAAMVLAGEDRRVIDEFELRRRIDALPLDDVEVDLTVVGGTEWGLLDAMSRRSQVLVIGSRDLAAWRGLLGRTSTHVTTHAHGPVLVVPAASRSARYAGALAAVIPAQRS